MYGIDLLIDVPLPTLVHVLLSLLSSHVKFPTAPAALIVCEEDKHTVPDGPDRTPVDA